MEFRCPLCSELFSIASSFASHMDAKGEHIPCTHPGCTVTFKNKQNMERHVTAEHSLERPRVRLPQYQDIDRHWQERIDFLFGRNTSSRTSEWPLEHGVESKPASEECFEERMGVLPIVKVPVSAPPTTRSASPHKANAESRDSRWSVISKGQYDEAIAKLRARVHSQDLLEMRGYLRSSQDTHFQSAPPASPSNPKLRAVALDCEMVGCRDRQKEHNVLARLSVVDYLTGEIIIDSLVQPDMRVTNWRTRFSGVTPAAMNAAVKAGQALYGHEGARKALWKHVDSETVIVGQSLTNDLAALKITHSRLVDSGIVTAEVVNIWGLTLIGLKISCQELLKIKIQQNRSKGHDSIEDSLAAREVVLFCLNETEQVERWAEGRREKEAERLAEIEKQRKEALDRAPWTREEWPRTVAYKRGDIVVQLPRFENMLVRDRSEHYEFIHIQPPAIWPTTIEEFRDLVEETKDGEAPKFRVKLPPKSPADSEDKSDDEAWKDAIESQESYSFETPQELLVDLLSEPPQTILDQPLDLSEDSFLTVPLMPCSQSHIKQPLVRTESWEDLTA